MAKPASLADLLSSATKASGQYRSYGSLDDKALDDQDIQFTGINQRLQLNQLAPTEVRESLNGRMEGYWKPRKSVVVKSSGLSGTGTPLKLPFYLLNTAKTITAASLATSTVTITIVGHGLAAGTTGWAKVSGITGYSGTDPNGTFLLTRSTADTLTYTITGSSGTYGVSSALLSQAPLNDNTATIFGSCLFSDPSSNSNESILIATSSSIKRVNLSDFNSTNLSYPSGVTLTNEVEMLQAFDKVIMFRNGQQSLQWLGGTNTSLYKSPAGAFFQPTLFTPTSFALSNGKLTMRSNNKTLNATITIAAGTTFVLPEVWDDGTPASLKDDYYFDATTNAITIGGVGNTVIDYAASTRTITLGTAVAAGSYLVSITTHGLEIGDVIIISAVSHLNGMNVGDEYVVGFTDSVHQFGFFANISAGSGNISVTLGKVQTSAIGFMFQPAPPWAEYFQRRLWVPFNYSQTGTYNNPVFADRKIRDEIAVSDILDSDTFDQIYSQFKISGGTADYIVGMHGFYDDAMIILNRNSIHSVKGTAGSLADTSVRELTSEVGCLARKSIVMQGNTLIFLSDNGVYALEFLNDYNLRGTEQPLSKNIQPYIDRINKDKADKSVGVYYDNRYWLAVPLDSSVGADDAVGNNSILIFNFLNGAWESVDTYADVRFNILNLHVAKAGVRNDLYIVTANGGIHKVDDSDSNLDIVSVDTTSSLETSLPINATLTTRGYDMGDMGRKRFNDIQLQMQALPTDSSAAFDISFSAEDPDNSSFVGNTEDSIGEVLKESDTANVRTRIGGIRGYTGTVIIKRTKGSPKLHSVKLSSTITNRSIISQN